MCPEGTDGTSKHEDQAAPKRRFRFGILALYVALVSAWGVGGLLAWSGAFRSSLGPMGKTFALVVALPLGLTTWPAHELVLELVTGQGAGANANIPAQYDTAALFIAWAAILWSPLVAAFWRKAPLWLVLVFQATLLFTVAANFWQYGNG